MTNPEPENISRSVSLHWLDQVSPAAPQGVSFGVPWPKGQLQPGTALTLHTADNEAIPMQNWVMATWPDGSLKWSGHAISAAAETAAPLTLSPGQPAVPATPLKIREDASSIEIDTGVMHCRLAKEGANFIEAILMDGRPVAQHGRLIVIREDRSQYESQRILREEEFISQIKAVEVEQRGSVRAVVKVTGVHRAVDADRTWLPFTIRLYFYAGLESIRLVHTFIFDGNAEQDFICGLGLAFSVPLREELHNRHVRFSGQGDGLWAEPVRPLTGWQKLIHEGREVYPDQIAGRPVPNQAAYDERGQGWIDDWVAWRDYKLSQSTADGFTIQKRTNAQSAWIQAAAGQRASGLAFVGDISGGLAVGRKDFWQSYPAALEICNAATDLAELRVWLWSPDVPAMDLRHYDTKAHGLEASYEDVQPGFSIPHGIARTSEMTLFPSAGLPDKAEMVQAAQLSNQPPLLVCSPEYYHAVPAFGVWSLPDRSSPGKRWLEDQLEKAIAFYQLEVEQRHWYGFWDYGDVMHAYDPQRHVWRYDIGGYAWANTELMPDMWLWVSFLRTGRADIFRMAEAMSRHTGEVDVYHLGRFVGLGSRHNVRHWGCGAKEVRIGQAALRRYAYYLTTDERSGDLMREATEHSEKAIGEINPLRMIMPPPQHPTYARFGPDWLALAGNWLTEWERTGDTRWRDKIMIGVACLAEMPYGCFSGLDGAFEYDPETSKLYQLADDVIGFLHLTTIMGGAEVAFELSDLLDSPEWERLWLQFCELYGAPQAEIEAAFDRDVELGQPGPWYARLTAYAAYKTGNRALAERAWVWFLTGRRRGVNYPFAFEPISIEGPQTLHPIREIPWISTNFTAQWCLNAIEILALVGDDIPVHSPLWADVPANDESST